MTWRTISRQSTQIFIISLSFRVSLFFLPLLFFPPNGAAAERFVTELAEATTVLAYSSSSSSVWVLGKASSDEVRCWLCLRLMSGELGAVELQEAVEPPPPPELLKKDGILSLNLKDSDFLTLLDLSFVSADVCALDVEAEGGSNVNTGVVLNCSKGIDILVLHL